MTGVVWKFPLSDITTEFRLLMPAGAKLLSVAVQRDAPYIWALVKPEAPTVARSFVLSNTGGAIEVPDTAVFVGTFLLSGGTLVFHLWDLGDGTEVRDGL